MNKVSVQKIHDKTGICYDLVAGDVTLRGYNDRSEAIKRAEEINLSIADKTAVMDVMSTPYSEETEYAIYIRTPISTIFLNGYNHIPMEKIKKDLAHFRLALGLHNLS